MTVLKPGRYAGASWIDNFVSRKRSVSLCEDCDRKYKGWHTKHNYIERSAKELTDCDGCGNVLQTCHGYYHSIV